MAASVVAPRIPSTAKVQTLRAAQETYERSSHVKTGVAKRPPASRTRVSILPQFAKDILAGTAGGVGAVVAAQPLDTIRIRMISNNAANPSSSMIACGQSIVAREGVMGLYKGMSAPVAGAGLLMAIMFSSRGQASDVLRTHYGPSFTPQFHHSVACGMFGGLMQAPVATPIELIKIRQQTSRSSPPSASAILQAVVGAQGLKGLQRGLLATALRDCIGYGCFLGAAEMGMRALTPEGASRKDLSLGTVMCVGMATGMWYWIPTFPFETCKTRMQNDCLTNPRYSGLADCMRQTVQQGGVRSLFRGLGSTIAFSVPRNGAKLLCFELARRLLTDL